MPRNVPRGTVFAAETVKGDEFGVDFVTLGGFHGTRALQAARNGPKATTDAVRLAKGDFPSAVIVAIVLLHGTHGMGHSKGDDSLVVTNENRPLVT